MEDSPFLLPQLESNLSLWKDTHEYDPWQSSIHQFCHHSRSCHNIRVSHIVDISRQWIRSCLNDIMNMSRSASDWSAGGYQNYRIIPTGDHKMATSIEKAVKVSRRCQWFELTKRETRKWKRTGPSRPSQSMNYRDRKGFIDSLSSIKYLFCDDIWYSDFEIWIGWLRVGQHHNLWNLRNECFFLFLSEFCGITQQE
jgi:hypothetical protein